MKNTVQLKFLWKIYNLKVLKSEYLNNNKPYLWLVNPKTWEYFSDITVNLPWLDHLKWYNFIDPDFIELCFSYIYTLLIVGQSRKRSMQAEWESSKRIPTYFL